MNVFPGFIDELDESKKKEGSKTIVSRIFGNRFRSDQTLYEYLIEFLLVFTSAKDANLELGKMKFHDISINKEMSYWTKPRMGLRRFIFYDKSRKSSSIKADEEAYKKMKEILFSKMEDINEENGKEYIESIQDLLHGYAVVIKKRAWCAQAILPICPELIFCGAMPNEKKRLKLVDWENNPETVDTKFDFDKRNFLSRGGELYYLHLLQGLENNNDKKSKLEMLLNDLISGQCKSISKISAFIQNSWEEEIGFDKSDVIKMKLAFIPKDAYVECEQNSIDELINYLSCKLHPINRIEILAKGIMFQIMRMMSCAVASYLKVEKKKWIIDMRGSSTDTVKKIAAEMYRRIEDDFMTALNEMSKEINIDENDIMKKVHEAKINSFDIFKSKGKELQCIIPISGSFERFSLSEDIIRFLVLSLIAPQKKMTLNMFLEKLYEHYGIVIGPYEYRRSLNNKSNIDVSLANSFNDNVIAFQDFLKATGFLRELSDATSIVVNPYTNILEEEN